MSDEIPQLSSAQLLAEISEKLDRTLAAAGQASLQAARTTRLIGSNMQLDARNRMAQVDTVETFRRSVNQLVTVLRQLDERPHTRTVVRDVTEDDARDITGVYFVGKRVPTKWAVGGAIILGALVMFLAMKVPAFLAVLGAL